MKTSYGYAAVLLAGLCATGCATSPETRFYVLSNGNADGNSTQNDASDRPIGVRITSFPAYLDRPQIVKRGTNNRLVMAQFDQWAEPLEGGFSRQLQENLAREGGISDVHSFPWPQRIDIATVVDLEITRFEAQPADEVKLAARWKLINPDDRRVVLSRQSEIDIPVKDSGFDGLVRAMSAALSELSSQLAAALRERG